MAWAAHWLSGWAAGDTTAPTPNITAGPTRSRISRQATVDASEISWTANEAFQAYQIRAVASASDGVSAGTLVESGPGGSAGTTYMSTITDDELVAAGLGGQLLLKLFVQDLAGNWSA